MVTSLDVDATFGEEFFDISVGASVSEVPVDGQHDHLVWEPVAGDRCPSPQRNKAA
jgi:hypothetical protein